MSAQLELALFVQAVSVRRGLEPEASLEACVFNRSTDEPLHHL